MSTIEIRHPSQPAETRKLSKNQPLSIGRHNSNDICVDEDDVASMHCRISWNKQNFEVSAAHADGVDLNGTLVRHSVLKPGDLLRVGSVDIVVHSDDAGASEAEGAEQDIGLKPVTEDQISALRRAGSTSAATTSGAKAGDSVRTPPPRKSSSRRAESASEPRDDAPRKVPPPEDSVIDLAAQDPSGGIVLSRSRSAEEVELEEEKPSEESLVERMKSRAEARRVRPGEEDTLRSPFVLGLAGASLALLLLAAVFYFVIGRESAQRAFDAADNELNQGKYTQAIELFEKFLSLYPRHSLADEALDKLWTARIEKEISGAAPAWKRGLDTLRDYIDASRDRPSSANRNQEFGRFALRIAVGSADSAAANPSAAAKPRELLAVAEDGRKLVGRYSPEGNVPAETAEQMASAIQKAEAAITRQETFDAHVAEIEQALADRQTMPALEARLRLLALYPEFATHAKVAALLQATLDTERQLVTREEPDQEALVDDHPPLAPRPLSLMLQTRSRTDEVSAGRNVFALAADCCYGIDSVTGDPIWRRPIGFDAPFFPIPVTARKPGLLLFDARLGELLLVDQRTGELQWRQPLAEPLSGAPLVHESQIYVPTLGNHLYRIDLESGRLTTRLTFSQKTLAPPALVSGGERLVVAGDQAIFYTLTTRPLECVRVTYTGHQAGSITAPLLTMGSLILIAEGNREAGSLLRVLDARSDDQWLNEISRAEVAGQLRDAPAIRGKELFVASGGERITAFTISDDPGQRPLTPIARVQVQTPHPGPIFLSPGPDGQLWMAGSAVRKLQLKTESIRLDPAEIAAGFSTQPLQNISQYLYIGRRLPYSNAVLFTQAERESMTGQWRIVLGARILAMTTSSDGAALCVTESGDVYLAPPGEIEQGGFKRTTTAQLKIPAPLDEPLRGTTLADGRIVVHCGGAEPQLWIVSPSGQVERQLSLQQPLEANPVLLAEGLVLPLPGRLRLIRSTSGKGAEDYVAPVEKDQAAKWIHLQAIDDTDVAAVDDRGRLVRVQLRQSPVPHLAEVAARPLEAPIEAPFGAFDRHLLLPGAGGALLKLDSGTMETESEAKFEGPATGPVTVIGNRAFVEAGGGRLCCFDVSDECRLVWTLALEGSPMAGGPSLASGRLIVAQQNGDVLSVDPETGEIGGRLHLVQPLSLGPRVAGPALLVATIDGSLVRVESVLQAQP